MVKQSSHFQFGVGFSNVMSVLLSVQSLSKVHIFQFGVGFSNVMSVLLSVQSLSKVHIFNSEVPHNQASLHCDSIGGHFPLPTSSQVKLKTKTNLKSLEQGFQPFLDGVPPNSQTI
jgi:hypothetical protein